MVKSRSSFGPSGRSHGVARTGPSTWLGGRFSLPAYVHEGEPYRPAGVLWLDLEEGFVRAAQIGRPPLDRPTIAKTLHQAIANPLAGTPGEPRSVRVGDAEMAAIAREVLGDGVAVEVGPIPELQAVVEDLGRAMVEGPPAESRRSGGKGRRGGSGRKGRRRDDGDGYLGGGRVSLEVAESLFAASRELVEVAPWRRMSDSAVFAVDIPALGISGACLSVIGALDRDLGFVLFDSVGSYESFLTLAELTEGDQPPPRHRLRGYLLSLNLERWGDLSAAMRREIRQHDWKVAGPRGHPQLICLDDDGVPRPLSERDFRLAAACATGVAQFCAAHQDVLDPPPEPPVTRLIRPVIAGQEMEVALTLPHPGAAEHADLRSNPYPAPPASRIEAPPPRSSRGGTPVQGVAAYEPASSALEAESRTVARVGRNDPCPCGSGKKYKRCHGGLGPAEASAEVVRADERAERAMRWHERDRRLISEMFEVATLRFDDSWKDLFEAGMALIPDRTGAQLIVPWLAFHARLRDRPLADWFLQMRGAYLTRDDRTWLEAARKAWISVWEVLDVSPGRALVLRDLLTGEKIEVVESSASRDLARFDVVLARIVSVQDLAVICGMHGRVLGPRPAAVVVQAVRRRLRLRSKAVAPEHLRTEEATRVLITAWQRRVTEQAKRRERMEVRNTEGHRLLMTTDRYRFEPARRAEVVARLEYLARRDDAAEGESKPAEAFTRSAGGSASGSGDTVHFSVTRPSDLASTGLDSVTVCHLSVHRDAIVAESNSRERADDVRAAIERECAGLVEHVGRSHVDPMSSAHRGDGEIEGAQDPPPIEAVEYILELKRRHYAAWLDARLPVLGGLSPRELSKTAGGRRELALLLREVENVEARSPAGQRYDVEGLWRELGIDPPV